MRYGCGQAAVASAVSAEFRGAQAASLLVLAAGQNKLCSPGFGVLAETNFSAETFTEGNEDGEEAAELDLFANTFVSFVAFCEDF
jgi:hypothetical protein